MTIQRLGATNFAAFENVDLRFSAGLNVIVGENGLGKTHLLKLPYAVMSASAELGRKPNAGRPTKAALAPRLAEKLVNVFRPDSLGRLTRRRPGRNRCAVEVEFADGDMNIGFEFATQSKSEVTVTRVPNLWRSARPTFLPTHELLTIYPWFVALYDTHSLPFDETWYDTCLLLGAPALKGPRTGAAARVLEVLEEQMNGQLILDSNGRFYLKQTGLGKLEIPLVAEGLRKLGMLARLVSTGFPVGNDCLFWDEPEANLNPKLIREVARAILAICESGVQVMVATHSLFLLREFEILGFREFSGVDQRYFALSREDNSVRVSQGSMSDDVNPLILLDEELDQSNRFLSCSDR